MQGATGAHENQYPSAKFEVWQQVVFCVIFNDAPQVNTPAWTSRLPRPQPVRRSEDHKYVPCPGLSSTHRLGQPLPRASSIDPTRGLNSQGQLSTVSLTRVQSASFATVLTERIRRPAPRCFRTDRGSSERARDRRLRLIGLIAPEDFVDGAYGP